MDHISNCPKCNEVIVKSTGAEVKIRSKILICKGGKAFAVCPKCSTESEVPLLLNEPMVKSIQESRPTVPLWIRSKNS